MLIDSHCHLNCVKTDHFENGLDGVIDNAKSYGVYKMVTIGCTLEEISELQHLSAQYEEVFHTVGVHPSEWDGEEPDADQLVSASTDPKCVGIGETGLDYYYNDESYHNPQKVRFARQIHVASAVQKPVIIHSRGAKKDTIDVMKSENASHCGGIMHCFTEDWEMAKQALDMGFFISFSGIVTFKNAKSVQEVAKKVPYDRILVETDSPYLAPVPFRGKTNYPGLTYYVAKFLADLRQIPFDKFKAQITANTEHVFPGLAAT